MCGASDNELPTSAIQIIESYPTQNLKACTSIAKLRCSVHITGRADDRTRKGSME
ncbi:hypothetical protein KIN20_028530 [Parelaphostrongylus tenuis]|uniref:Uncharacterized protein n=1 Tax=Parelaphostrongylus tenuis TaxID=148309 RepID=A0AAD5R1R0_PARTN|nr:hypothetical protein KIN20_028530 [Parelaphostrongylus tenuis]